MRGKKGKYNYNGIKCPICEEKERIEKEERDRNRNERYKKEKEERTNYYIETYLNPNCSWKKGIKTYSKMNSLLSDVYFDKIKEHIVDMDYYDFLETPYWKAISEKVKYKADYRCMICNGTGNLNVHHRTYDNHGDELHHMGDLICLCHECHEKHHFE